MKIAYLVQQFPPEIGAGPARVVELSQRWQAAGASVTVITAMPSRIVPGLKAGTVASEYRRKVFMREDWHGIDVLRSWSYSSNRPGFLTTLANNVSFMLAATAHGLARLRNADVLIASSPPFFPHIAGFVIAKLRRIPLVLEVRDLWPDYLVGMGIVRRNSLAGRCLFALERFLLRRAAAVVVVTESFARILATKGVDSTRIVVIPNGVDLSRYYRSDMEHASGGTNGQFTVGYLGNFGAGQDLSTVVRAAQLLAGQGVHVVLVGDGPDRARIDDLVRALGLDNITIRNSIPKDETLACYHSFDVCLVPLAPIAEFQDTIPSKIFEIMACERPILASASGETERLVEAAGCGIAVPPGNAEAIAKAIIEFRAMTPAQLRAYGVRGRAFVGDRYSRDPLATRYLALLNAVTKQNGRVPPETAEYNQADLV